MASAIRTAEELYETYMEFLADYESEKMLSNQLLSEKYCRLAASITLN